MIYFRVFKSLLVFFSFSILIPFHSLACDFCEKMECEAENEKNCLVYKQGQSLTSSRSVQSASRKRSRKETHNEPSDEKKSKILKESLDSTASSSSAQKNLLKTPSLALPNQINDFNLISAIPLDVRRLSADFLTASEFIYLSDTSSTSMREAKLDSTYEYLKFLDALVKNFDQQDNQGKSLFEGERGSELFRKLMLLEDFLEQKKHSLVENRAEGDSGEVFTQIKVLQGRIRSVRHEMGHSEELEETQRKNFDLFKSSPLSRAKILTFKNLYEKSNVKNKNLLKEMVLFAQENYRPLILPFFMSHRSEVPQEERNELDLKHLLLYSIRTCEKDPEEQSQFFEIYLKELQKNRLSTTVGKDLVEVAQVSRNNERLQDKILTLLEDETQMSSYESLMVLVELSKVQKTNSVLQLNIFNTFEARGLFEVLDNRSSDDEKVSHMHSVIWVTLGSLASHNEILREVILKKIVEKLKFFNFSTSLFLNLIGPQSETEKLQASHILKQAIDLETSKNFLNVYNLEQLIPLLKDCADYKLLIFKSLVMKELKLDQVGVDEERVICLKVKSLFESIILDLLLDGQAFYPTMNFLEKNMNSLLINEKTVLDFFKEIIFKREFVMDLAKRPVFSSQQKKRLTKVFDFLTPYDFKVMQEEEGDAEMSHQVDKFFVSVILHFSLKK